MFQSRLLFAKALNIMIGIGRARRKLIDQLVVRTLPLNWVESLSNLPEIIFTVISSFSRLLFSTSILRTCIKMLFWLHQVVSYRREARGGGGSWERNCFVEHRKKIFFSVRSVSTVCKQPHGDRLEWISLRHGHFVAEVLIKKGLKGCRMALWGAADSDKGKTSQANRWRL